jgi:acylphosphatase
MAEGQGISGWCRNLPDRKVEACFEGDPAAVERAVAWCRSGPPGALVTSVEIITETPHGERGFSLG